MPPSPEQDRREQHDVDIIRLARNVTLIGIVITGLGRAWRVFQHRRTESQADSPYNGRWRDLEFETAQPGIPVAPDQPDLSAN